MVGALLVGAAVATALLAACAARFPSLVSTLLAAYLALVANLGLTTLVLSPIHQVTRAGLAVAEGLLLAAALGAWWARGRPGPPLAGARAASADDDQQGCSSEESEPIGQQSSQARGVVHGRPLVKHRGT